MTSMLYIHFFKNNRVELTFQLKFRLLRAIYYYTILMHAAWRINHQQTLLVVGQLVDELNMTKSPEDLLRGHIIIPERFYWPYV